MITATEVSLNGKLIAPVDGSPFAIPLAGALPANPADPTIVVQADRALPSATINEAVEAAAKAGYTNMLFAVKNK